MIKMNYKVKNNKSHIIVMYTLIWLLETIFQPFVLFLEQNGNH